MTRIRLHDVVTFFRFGLSGLPGFVLAIGLNVLLVELCHWPKPLAYLPVMWLQMTMGFIMCRWVVFSVSPGQGLLTAYFQFAVSMALIRIADWILYTSLVEAAKIPFVVAQLSSTGLFIVIKFLSARAIFRSKSSAASRNS